MNRSGSSERSEASEQLLHERARRLAEVPARVGNEAEAEVMLFRLREEQHAVEIKLLQAVQHAQGLTAVPCTPSHVAGILNVRGEVVTVLALAAALGIGGEAPQERAKVLLVTVGARRVGLLVDEVIGVGRLNLERLDPPLSGREVVRGVAEGQILLLNLEHLLLEGHVEVLEDVT